MSYSSASEKTPLFRSGATGSSKADPETSPFSAPPSTLSDSAAPSPGNRGGGLLGRLRCWNVKPQMRRRFLYFNISVFVFLNGVEYAVILPTMWLYISSSFDSSSSFLGLCIAAYSISALLFCPVAGYLNDWTRDTRTLVIVCNTFEIIGNIFYLFRYEWFVFLARFISGIGAAAAPILFADVNRATLPSERTAVLSWVILFRQIGLFTGPAFNLFLSQMDFYIGPLHVDAYTAPGFIMTILWVLHQIQVFLTFYNIEEYAEMLQTPEDASNADVPSSRLRWDQCKSPQNFQVSQTFSPCMSPTFKDPVKPLKDKTELKKQMPDVVMAAGGMVVKEKVPWRVYWDEYSEENIIVLMGVSFIIFFAQTSLESMFTPLTEKFFHWGELENSGIFAVAGVTVLCVCMVVAWLSKRVNDRNITIVGLMLMVTSLIWSTSTLPGGYYGKPWLLFHFVVSSVLSVVGLSTCAITSFSLFSKAIGEKTQGFGSGLRRMIMNVGLIMGPLWSGALIDRLDAMLGVNLSVVTMVTILYLLSWKQMLPNKKRDGVVEIDA